jgi:hypothetical protein
VEQDVKDELCVPYILGCLVWTNPILPARLGAMHQDPLDVDTMGGRHRGIKVMPPPYRRSRTKSPTKSPTKPPTKLPTKAPVDTSWRLRSESVQGLVLHIAFSWSVDSVLTDDSLNPLAADLDGGGLLSWKWPRTFL